MINKSKQSKRFPCDFRSPLGTAKSLQLFVAHKWTTPEGCCSLYGSRPVLATDWVNVIQPVGRVRDDPVRFTPIQPRTTPS